MVGKMRSSLKHLEKYRVRSGPMATSPGERQGAFFVQYNRLITLKVICSDGTDWAESGLFGEPWEHVSVSCEARCPTHEEMEHVRKLFFSDSETVVSFSVARRQHINCHPYCLHLWRPTITPVMLPPGECVGPKEGGGDD